ncbi:MAG: histidine phosphatase family protein [Pseudomonadota bacterium]|jgi:alpha-ribazole phosphatase
MTQAHQAAVSLWLVRHARPIRPDGGSVDGYCYGQLDWPTEPHANAELAQRLAQRLPQQALLVSSSRQRCTRLAQQLLQLRHDLHYAGADARLDELHFGAWEGQRWDDLGAAALQAWVDDFAAHAPGGGESVQRLLDRVAAAWQAWQAAPLPCVVWLCHAGTAQALRWLLGYAHPGPSQGLPIAPALPRPQAHTWPRSNIPFGGSLIFPRTYPK